MNKINNKEEIVETYIKTGSTKKTAEILGIKASRVRYVAKQYGVLKNVSESQRKYTYNEHYFDVIDDEHKAYWLGFLYADGCVCYEDKSPRFSFVLSSADIDTINLFKKDICLNSPTIIHEKHSGKFKGTKNVGVYIRSKHLCDTLESHGCVRRKSYVMKFPQNLKEDLIRHFIRGYFDGNGSAFISKEKHWRKGTITDVLHFRFCGTYDMMYNIDKMIGLNGRIVIQHKDYDDRIYELSYKRRKKAVIFYKYLYEDATIFLKRKKDVFESHFRKMFRDYNQPTLYELKG